MISCQRNFSVIVVPPLGTQVSNFTLLVVDQNNSKSTEIPVSVELARGGIKITAKLKNLSNKNAYFAALGFTANDTFEERTIHVHSQHFKTMARTKDIKTNLSKCNKKYTCINAVSEPDWRAEAPRATFIPLQEDTIQEIQLQTIRNLPASLLSDTIPPLVLTDIFP